MWWKCKRCFRCEKICLSNRCHFDISIINFCWYDLTRLENFLKDFSYWRRLLCFQGPEHWFCFRWLPYHRDYGNQNDFSSSGSSHGYWRLFSKFSYLQKNNSADSSSKTCRFGAHLHCGSQVCWYPTDFHRKDSNRLQRSGGNHVHISSFLWPYVICIKHWSASIHYECSINRWRKLSSRIYAIWRHKLSIFK